MGKHEVQRWRHRKPSLVARVKRAQAARQASRLREAQTARTHRQLQALIANVSK